MATVLLIIHLFVTLALIGVVLIQRSEGGGLGIGSTQGMGSFMTGRGTANLLTRTTGILAAAFFALSLALALINRGTVGAGRSILDTTPTALPALPAAPAAPGSAMPGQTAPGAGAQTPATQAPAAQAPAPAAPAPATPAAPSGPSVPTN